MRIAIKSSGIVPGIVLFFIRCRSRLLFRSLRHHLASVSGAALHERVAFNYKNKHNNREKGEETRRKTKEKIQKKQGRKAQGKTKDGILPANGTRRGDGTKLDIHRQPKKSHLMEAIVILPRNMLYSTDISVTLRISAGNQQNGKTVKQRNRENIAEPFGRDSKTIRKHIANAIKEELADEVVVANFATTTEHSVIKGKSQTHHARFAVS